MSTTRAQHVAPNRKANAGDQPFPNKPVGYRRPRRTQVPLDFSDCGIKTISGQPGGPLSSQERHSKDIREASGSCRSGRDPHRVPTEELQMARAIHAKEIMLQEKLWKVEDKIRQKIQRGGPDAAARVDQKSGEERHNRGQAQVKTRIPVQQRRDPVRSGDMLMQERRHVDLKHPRKKQDQRTEDRMRNTHEVQQARWDDVESPRYAGKGHKGTDGIIFKQEAKGELNKSRWQNVKEHSRRKGGEEKDHGIWGGTEKTKCSEQNKAYVRDTGRTRERTHKERTHKEPEGADAERATPQRSHQKTAHRPAAGSRRGAGGKLAEDSTLPLVSSPSEGSGPPQGELALADSTDVGLQLLPCTICNRRFAGERLERHVQICEKLSHRQVYSSYLHRMKGTTNEEYLKIHSRSKTPEALKKEYQQRRQRRNLSTVPRGRLPAK
ncbi:zinc finger C2HC domain-containing protein 1C-like [Brachyistius frenatus]|uniref:zinc finger C2HC domain-containing protein 1C-like n=1 Tax=Brachyistius frenatus TaxID=100188 RepID=UPI0037E948D0